MTKAEIIATVKSGGMEKLKSLIEKFPDPNDWESRTTYLLIKNLVENYYRG